MGNVKLEFPVDALRELVAEVVKEVLSQREKEAGSQAATVQAQPILHVSVKRPGRRRRGRKSA